MKELILLYIKSWIADIINCRKNRKQVVSLTQNILKLKKEQELLNNKIRFLENEYNLQEIKIKTVVSLYNKEQTKTEKLAEKLSENLNKLIGRPVYKNEAIDEEGLGIINNLIQGDSDVEK